MQGDVKTHGPGAASRKLPYDPLDDLTAIGMTGATPNVLVVNASLPVMTVMTVRRSLIKARSRA